MANEYFETGKKFALLAHRGLVIPETGTVENTEAAFQLALQFGATHLETDVQATRDGVAVLFHDADLTRVAGDSRRLSAVTLQELRAICSRAGFSVLTLRDALANFPNAKFNLDIKSWQAVESAAESINRAAAHARVLVSSFSDQRRILTLRHLSRPVATSGGSATVLRARLAGLIAAKRLLNSALIGVQALQIPTAMYGTRFATESFVSQIREANVEVHFWTINSPDLAIQLLNLGATGLVTDRVDLLAPLLGKG